MANTTDFAAPTRRADPACGENPGENLRHNRSDERLVSAGSLVGYARVSQSQQVLDRQMDALGHLGCERVFTDHGVSGLLASRPGLDACLDYLRTGDTLVVQSLDRLGRRTSELLRLVEDLGGQGIALRVLNLGIDTGTPAGHMVLSIMAALAQMERDVLAERTRQGLAAARARGRVGGRPRTLTDEQVRVASDWRGQGRSWAEIARLLGSSERTVKRRVEAIAV